MSPYIHDGVDPQPFRAWANEWLRPATRAPSSIGEVAAERTVSELARELGIGERRLWRWRYEVKSIDKAEMTEALHRAGLGLWDVYGDQADETPKLTHWYCPTCNEDCPVDSDLSCLWCATPTRKAKRKGGTPPGVYGKLSDDQLRALHRFHADGGLSIRELGRRVWEKAGYASWESAAHGIRIGFNRLHLTVHKRSHQDLQVPRCSAVKSSPPGVGRRCRSFVAAGSEFCRLHDPARREEVVAHARAMVETRTAA